MTSTRNKNTKSDYCLQQRENILLNNYNIYENSQYGSAYKASIPCLGITPSHMSRDVLSNNSIDIESSLFGINSSNLVEEKKPVIPELKNIPSISYFERIELIMPKPLVVEKFQRPFPIPE
jgi:hypothetical protein